MSRSKPWALTLSCLLSACAAPVPPTSSQTPTLSAATPPTASEPPIVTATLVGLKTEHADHQPLLDRIAFLGHGALRATRTYPDGAQYILVNDPNALSTSPPHWTPFVQLWSR